MPGVEKKTVRSMGVLHQNMHVLNAMGGVGAGAGLGPASAGGGAGAGGDARNHKPAPVVAPRQNTTRMDDFTVVRKLGKGSFGVVYACTRKKDPSKKMLVVKVGMRVGRKGRGWRGGHGDVERGGR